MNKYLKNLCFAAATVTLMASAPSAFALSEVTGFGTNPGALKMFKHVPTSMPTNAPLIVAMHGCTQSASAYEGSGWSALANNYKFYVVYPEQQSGNNSNKCFNWFESGDIARGQGEALSIKQMVDKMKADYSIDANRVYVTGLSAGAFMTAVMAATYPDVFAGAAPIAGGPYKCATSMIDAFSCMSPGTDKTPAAWGDLARGGYSGYNGRKPKISVWQGSSDTTVKPMNMDELMQQWTNYHGIDQTADVSETVKGFPHKVYKDASGNALVETWSITGMAHGTPVDPGTGAEQCGTSGSYILDVNICSSYHIAQFFGLTGAGTTTTTTVGSTSTTTGYTSTSSAPVTTTTSVASTTTTTVAAGACYNASNYAHVTAGRAVNSMGYAKAKGSNQNMGLYNTFTTSKLREAPAGYFTIDSTCP
ncbi:poly(hydroxyalkanoate) depolymerase family esterase [Paucimonas lemoignei]|uniref:Poly(3-hydroxybutyrate)depolymerase D n=1 Tax=Paucimonas lemoignei TaxID=29443 RepID=P72207_PAULE|nr:PHB depolymerase family esterase [Paucimonas lemoignei]AAB48166.1 poly(3-hydroxybutyrate)depolymerase D precursor [Paucimonas lemoignei]TCS39318.1 poly(hydroxyalkanoate) depolymerase family esterase [Paucimonas lemoignei]